MVFAVAMTMIDQTIVAIAVPQIERDLDLTPTGAQWIINGYLLALATLFALGGKVSDVFGRRQMVTVGVVGFGVSSAFCGLAPASGIGQEWMILFRVLQGAFGAVLFPAAAGIVAASFERGERGRAMAIFFAVTGALTAIGPFLGGYLMESSWRLIFWVNVPIGVIALILIWRSKPDAERRPQPIDIRGTLLFCVSMGLIVLGLQQSGVWGWQSAYTWTSIGVGVVVGAVFVWWQLRIEFPLLQLRIFQSRVFSVENFALASMSVVYVPFCYFASVYAQVSLGKTPVSAGFYILFFFIGVLSAAQVGGRILDKRSAWPAVVGGSAISAFGLAMLARSLDDLSISGEWLWVIFAGAGIGMILSSAATDAIQHAPSTAFSEATGITQTSRNLGASFGMAVLGTLLIIQNRTNVANALEANGIGAQQAEHVATTIGSGSASAGLPADASKAAVEAFELAFAHSCRTVFLVMAGVMAATGVIAAALLPRSEG